MSTTESAELDSVGGKTSDTLNLEKNEKNETIEEVNDNRSKADDDDNVLLFPCFLLFYSYFYYIILSG